MNPYVELVRLPAALSVPGDTVAGAVAAAGPAGMRGRLLLLPGASATMYWAGMALNDWADADLDAEERPERPIPSGRISRGSALAVGAGLSATGVALGALGGGRRGLTVALGLAGVVWAYDTVLKSAPVAAAGPAGMAAARGLDVLLGAAGAGGAGGLRAGLAPAALLAGHTAGVTTLSRGEVHGASPATARAVVGTTVATGLGAAALGARTALARPGRSRRSAIGRAVLSGTLAAVYAATVGKSQAAALGGEAAQVRSATGAGIRGMIPLQAALTASRAPASALGVLAAGPVAKVATRVVSPT